LYDELVGVVEAGGEGVKEVVEEYLGEEEREGLAVMEDEEGRVVVESLALLVGEEGGDDKEEVEEDILIYVKDLIRLER